VRRCQHERCDESDGQAEPDDEGRKRFPGAHSRTVKLT
jgi:hypothetical protein